MATRTIVEPTGIDPRSPESLASLIKLASHSGQNVGRSARYLLDKIDQLQDAGTWPRALPDAPRTWERFCMDVLGYPGEYVEKMREGIAVLDGEPTPDEAVTAAEVLRANGGDRRSKDFQCYDVTLKRGNNVPYLRARLKRDAPETLAALDRGEYPSVRAAAKAAGIVADPTPLDYLHRYWRKVDPDDRLRFLVEMLTPNERRALTLGFEEGEC